MNIFTNALLESEQPYMQSDSTIDSIFSKIERYQKMNYVRHSLNEKYLPNNSFDVAFTLNEQQLVYSVVADMQDSLLEKYLGPNYYNFYQQQFLNELKLFKKLKNTVNAVKQSSQKALDKTVDFMKKTGEQISVKFQMFINFLKKITEKGIKSVKQLIQFFFQLVVKTGLALRDFLDKIGVFKELEDVNPKDDGVKNVDTISNKAFKSNGEKNFFMYLIDFINTTKGNKEEVKALNEDTNWKDVIWSQSTGGPTWWIKIKRFIGRYTFGIRTKEDVGNLGRKTVIKRMLFGVCVSVIGGLLISTTLVYVGAATWVYILVMAVWHSRALIRVFTTRYVTKKPDDPFFPKFPNLGAMQIVDTVNKKGKTRKRIHIPDKDKEGLSFWLSLTMAIASVVSSGFIQANTFGIKDEIRKVYAAVLKPVGQALSGVPILGDWLNALNSQQELQDLQQASQDLQNNGTIEVNESDINNGQGAVDAPSTNNSGNLDVYNWNLNNTNSGLIIDNEDLFPSDGSDGILGEDTQPLKDAVLKYKETDLGTGKGLYNKAYEFVNTPANKVQNPNDLYVLTDTRWFGHKPDFMDLNTDAFKKKFYEEVLLKAWMENGGGDANPFPVDANDIEINTGTITNDAYYEQTNHLAASMEILNIGAKDGTPLNVILPNGKSLHEVLPEYIQPIIHEAVDGTDAQNVKVFDYTTGGHQIPETIVQEATNYTTPEIITPNLSFVKNPGNLGVILSSSVKDRMFQITDIRWIELSELFGDVEDKNSFASIIQQHNNAVKQFKKDTDKKYKLFKKTAQIYNNQIKYHTELSQEEINTANQAKEGTYNTATNKWDKNKIALIKSYVKEIESANNRIISFAQEYVKSANKVLVFYTDDFYYVFKKRGVDDKKYKNQPVFFIDPQLGQGHDIAIYYKKRRQYPYYVKGLYARLIFHCDDKGKLANTLNCISEVTFSGLQSSQDNYLHNVLDYSDPKNITVASSFTGNPDEKLANLGNFTLNEFIGLLNDEKNITNYYSGKYADNSLMTGTSKNLVHKYREQENKQDWLNRNIIDIFNKHPEVKDLLLNNSKYAHLKKYIVNQNGDVDTQTLEPFTDYFMRSNTNDTLTKKEFDQEIKQVLDQINKNNNGELYSKHEERVVTTELKNFIELLLKYKKNVYAKQNGLDSKGKSWIDNQQNKNDIA